MRAVHLLQRGLLTERPAAQHRLSDQQQTREVTQASITARGDDWSGFYLLYLSDPKHKTEVVQQPLPRWESYFWTESLSGFHKTFNLAKKGSAGRN